MGSRRCWSLSSWPRRCRPPRRPPAAWCSPCTRCMPRQSPAWSAGRSCLQPSACSGRYCARVADGGRRPWLAWPLNLSADYGPRVIPAYRAVSLAALGGTVIIAATLAGGWWIRRTAPTVTFAAWAAAAAYLPTSNLLFPSGIVLAERALYVPVLLTAALVGQAVHRAQGRWTPRAVALAIAAVCIVLGGRTLARLPVWRDNRTFLLTLLADHPESYWGH